MKKIFCAFFLEGNKSTSKVEVMNTLVISRTLLLLLFIFIIFTDLPLSLHKYTDRPLPDSSVEGHFLLHPLEP